MISVRLVPGSVIITLTRDNNRHAACNWESLRKVLRIVIV